MLKLIQDYLVNQRKVKPLDKLPTSPKPLEIPNRKLSANDVPLLSDDKLGGLSLGDTNSILTGGMGNRILAEAEASGDTEQIAKAKNLVGSLNQSRDIIGGIGSITEQIAINDDGSSDTGLATFGGALKGAAGLSSFGLLGVLGGGLLGGASGFAAANQSNADFYDNKQLNDVFKLSAKTVSPSAFGKGGLIDGDEFVAVQMELDENYVTSDMNIYDSKAKMKHEGMSDEDITDVVKDNSFAFSNREKIKPSTHADKTLGYGFAHYAEDGTFALSKVTMADVFGDSKKEIPFSKAANMIRKAFKVVRDDDKDADLLTQITNDENKQARLPFVTELMNIHEGESSQNDEPFVPQKFGRGGKMKKNKVKKYEGGGIMEIFDNLGLQLDELEEYNIDNFNTTNRDTSALFDRLNTRNGLSSIIQGLATGLQSTRVDPKLQDARFIDESFEEISPAIADQISSEGISRANSLVSNIARTSPGAAERVAPRLFDSALRQSNSSRLNILNNNLAQRRGKYKFLNKVGNANRSERIRADEATRNLINKKRRNLANIGTGFLQNRDRLDANRFQLDRENLRNRNTNRLSLLQNGINLASLKSQHGLSKDYIDLQNRQFESAAKGNNSATVGNNDGYRDAYFELLRQQLETEPIFDLPTMTEDDFAFFGSLA